MIVLTGAGGRTGKALLRALVARGADVRAFIRNPEQADGLLALGAAEVAVGDMTDADSINRWYPRVYFNTPDKVGNHRALADIIDSIDELRYYRNTMLVPQPGPDSDAAKAAARAKGFGDRVLIDDLSFTLPRNGIVGVIGPNGAGKTTLFRMITGEEQPDEGSVKVGETVKTSYVDQNRGGIEAEKTLWEVVSDGLDWIKVGNVEMPSRAYVSAFGFKGHDQQKPAGVLSGGERNRLNLALTLKQGGNLLLLDEPTNDLDVETLSSLENALLEFPGCAVVVSHDRWFLDRVTTHILAYEGESKWFWFEGNFESYEANKIERLGPDAARPHRATYRKLTRG